MNSGYLTHLSCALTCTVRTVHICSDPRDVVPSAVSSRAAPGGGAVCRGTAGVGPPTVSEGERAGGRHLAALQGGPL